MATAAKQYPEPTAAATTRAKYHLAAHLALQDIGESGQYGQGVVTLLHSEARRHLSMLNHYRNHYGPNAHI
jgi:hypothetical protein